MDKKDSFNSEEFSSPSDCEIEDTETKEQTHRNDKEEESETNNLANNELIKAIAQTLETILEENKNCPDYKEIIKKQKKMVFNADSIPNISLEDYLARIQIYSNLEKNTLIISLILIDRLSKLSDLVLTYYNIHRILFTSILLSIKYNEDCYYDNKFYSEIAGIKLKELNALEYTFSYMIDFNFFINKDIFRKYEQYLYHYKD